MEWWIYLLILVVGFIAGWINTVAGGGSLITMPVLIFSGLPPAVANGTNRIALFVQNIFGVAGFRSKGVNTFPYSLWLGFFALFGAIVGAFIAVDISGELFNRILAVVMLLVGVYIVLGGMKSEVAEQELHSPARKAIAYPVFFLIGIYGGFIQAGVGFLIMAAMKGIHHYSLVKTNSVKLTVVLIYTMSALAVFIYEDKVRWIPGLVLAVGNSAGAWLASRWSVKKGDKWIRILLLVIVVTFSIRLWWMSLT